MEKNSETVGPIVRNCDLTEKDDDGPNTDLVVQSDTDRNRKVNGDVVSSPTKDPITVTTNVIVPPDGGWGWVVVAASFFCNFVVDGITYSFGIFLPVLVEDLKESIPKVSLIISLMSGCYLIAGPFASALANRFGFRRVSLIGSALAASAFFLSSYASSTAFLYVTYGIMGGVGFGLIFVPAVITLGFYFEKWRALATGIAVCGSGIGTFVMAPISAWLIKNYGWRGALVIQAGFLLSCALCGALFRPLKPVSIQIAVPEKTDVEEESEDDSSKTKRPPPLLKTEIIENLKGKGKSRSLLNVYEDLGITVEEMKTKNEQRRYFSNNNQYPTASQILQLDVITDDGEDSGSTIKADDNTSKVATKLHQVNATKSSERRLMVLSNRELNTNCHANPSLQPRDSSCDLRNKSTTSPETLERNGIAPNAPPEMCILLNRKYSLQPHYKSQSFTVASTTTLASHKSNTLNRRHTDINNRPLYRDDIFFNSNLKRLPLYTSQASSLNYTMSVTRLPTYHDILEEKRRKFFIFPEAVRRALGTLLDVSLLRSMTFNVLAVSGFLTSMGMYTPFMYIHDRAKKFGIADAEALWLISVLGMANTLGRVGLGILSSMPRMNAVLINNISMTLCGVFTMLSGLFETPIYQFFYASVFGLTIACFAALRTIIIVDLLGLEKLTNAFGLLLLFQGIAAIIGPPLAGFFVQVTGRYDLPFYLSGALIILSAVICYPIERLNQWEQTQNLKKGESSS